MGREDEKGSGAPLGSRQELTRPGRAVRAAGAALLAVIVASFWSEPNDNFAYWLAGQRLAAGLPVYVTLKNVAVAKKLAAFDLK